MLQVNMLCQNKLQLRQISIKSAFKQKGLRIYDDTQHRQIDIQTLKIYKISLFSSRLKIKTISAKSKRS